MKGGAKVWFFMTVDCVYGRSLQAEATEFIEAHGGTVVGSTRHAFATKDFSSDILKTESSGAALASASRPAASGWSIPGSAAAGASGARRRSGRWSWAGSVAGTIFKAQTIQGSLTGTIQDLRDVLGLARQGRLVLTPIREMPKHLANEAMQRLEQRQVTGRVMLTDADPAGRPGH